MATSTSSRRIWLAALMGASCLLAEGCGEPEKVRHYQVPKDSIVQLENPGDPKRKTAVQESEVEAAPARMLAAYVPHGEDAWFFKFQGPPEEVAKHEGEFRKFLESVRFQNDGQGPPEWQLPSGWESLPGSEMRFATLHVPSKESPLEVSVTKFPKPEGDDPSYLLNNVNRWRGQLQLPPIEEKDLAGAIQPLPGEKRDGALVDFEGHSASGGAPRGRKSQAAGEADREQSSQERESPFAYATPEGWQSGKLGGFRVLAFQVERAGMAMEVTVSALGPEARAVAGNVNRWRDQVGLPPLSDDEARSSAQEIAVGDARGDFVELRGKSIAGAEFALWGVLLSHDDVTWVFKASGDMDLMDAEKAHFEEFLKSIRFPEK